MEDAVSGHATRPSDGLAHDLRRFGGKLKRRLRAQANIGDLTPSQVAVLLRLEQDGPLTTSALARGEGMRPQSMGAIIVALEGAGLVAGQPDPSDGRQTLLSLTDQCRTWMAEGRAVRQDWLARLIDARLSPDEQARLVAVIPLLQRLVEN
ncbi:MarR family winged helix-turn-helix transcriptional regulator [Sphingomonas oryzagri]|uniref:MarR family transcriptional regulator n=1 Tax=Sphingomonas oryzagri TaxID=3042314 RepID=A0ABT6N416_9SPHN|nr:MarR family transcriptional regulator [Sphingomonas oryzagri]MDH7640043.1 MarR family transcriptional regulator [Sphingomonas oryzagri]